MAQYTICTAADLQLIADEYGLGQLQATSVLEGGSQNTNYLLTTSSGSFVLTISEQHPAEEVGELIDLLRHLEQHGFQTSQVVPNQKGHYQSTWAGKPIMLKAFLPGEVITDFSPQQLERLGAETGRLHLIPSPDYLPRKLTYGREQFHQLDLYAAGSDYQKWLSRVQDYIDPYLEMGLPRALIHSDIFDNNVIVNAEEDSVVIMDFEEAAHYYRVFELGMAMVGVCRDGFNINTTKARHLLRGYQSIITLEAEERQALQPFLVYAAAAMSFWRHRQFNYLYPIPAKFDHYRALQQVADAAWALPAGALALE